MEGEEDIMLTQVTYNETVKNFLEKERIINLNIIGALAYLEESQIYVDDSKQPEGVFVIGKGIYYLYTKSQIFVDKVLEEFFYRPGYYAFSGVEREIADYIQSKYKVHWANPCDIYYYPHETIDRGDIQHEVRTISLEDAAMIDSFYTYQGEGSLEEIKENLKRRPSSGVYIEDELVCWVMVHEDDSMGIMYTKEAHRRKGYAVDVTIDLIDQMLKLNKTPYVQIVESNGMSPGLATKCGFVKDGKCTWFGIEVLG